MKDKKSHDALIELLRLAYSGEKAAAYAYQGHANSVRNSEEQNRIREIEQDEWHHRKLVGEILETLGYQPSNWKEFKATLIGRTASFLCYLTGWYAPMYGAGKLERRNVREYVTAAFYARNCGYKEHIDCLLEMAEVEWEHEKYFREKAIGHWLSKVIPVWKGPGSKESIRADFNKEASNNLLKPMSPRKRGFAGYR